MVAGDLECVTGVVSVILRFHTSNSASAAISFRACKFGNSLPSAKLGYSPVSSRTLCIVLPDPLGIHLTLMVVSD